MKLNKTIEYKIGDVVKIKSIDWYNNNKDKDGYACNTNFLPEMSEYCGKNAIITQDDMYYCIDLDGGNHWWSAYMFEDKVVSQHNCDNTQTKFNKNNIILNW